MKKIGGGMKMGFELKGEKAHKEAIDEIWRELNQRERKELSPKLKEYRRKLFAARNIFWEIVYYIFGKTIKALQKEENEEIRKKMVCQAAGATAEYEITSIASKLSEYIGKDKEVKLIEASVTMIGILQKILSAVAEMASLRDAETWRIAHHERMLLCNVLEQVESLAEDFIREGEIVSLKELEKNFERLWTPELNWILVFRDKMVYLTICVLKSTARLQFQHNNQR